MCGVHETSQIIQDWWSPNARKVYDRPCMAVEKPPVVFVRPLILNKVQTPHMDFKVHTSSPGDLVDSHRAHAWHTGKEST